MAFCSDSRLPQLNRTFSRLKRNTISTTAGNAALADRRGALLNDIDHVVPIVPLKYFPDYLLPALRHRNLVSETIKILERKKLINKKTDRWSCWPDEPCNMNGPDPVAGGRLLEDKVFAPLATLAGEIKNAATEARRSLSAKDSDIVFLCNPACVPISESRRDPSLSRPDGYALRKGHAVPIQWCDVVLPAEYKKGFSEDVKRDNYEKIIWSMSYIMQEDARRRFVFGFTVENCSMRMWFLSRSEILVSEEFNFMKDREIFVDFLLRTYFAKPSELGYDDTMTRLPVPSEIDSSVRYVIEVRDETAQPPVIKRYRTRRLISELGALSPRGRGTRVWEVYELDEAGEIAYELDKDGRKVPIIKVLKDTWTDVDRKIEGVILNTLEEKAEAMGKGDAFRKHFMRSSGYGHVYVDGRVDTTAGFRLSRLDEPKAEVSLTWPTLRVTNPERRVQILTRQGLVNTEAQHGEGTQHARYSAKSHHRIIYDEVGKPIFQAKSLCKAFICIGHVIQGLDLLHKLGWVHRDISYGNVLVIDGRGKITDLEYAKEEGDTSVHGIRTGTEYFMSTEVDSGQYKHLPRGRTSRPIAKKINPFADIEDIEAVDFALAGTKTQYEMVPSPATKPPPVPFRYNPLHDVESVVWLSFYLLLASVFRRPDHSTSEEAKTSDAKQDELFRNIFIVPQKRSDLMNPGMDVSEMFAGLHPTVERVASLLLEMRTSLLDSFADAEAKMSVDAPIPFNTAAKLTLSLCKQVWVIVDMLCKQDLEILTEDDFRPRRPVWKQIAPNDADSKGTSTKDTKNQGTTHSDDATTATGGANPEQHTLPQRSRTRLGPGPSGRLLRSHVGQIQSVQPTASRPMTRTQLKKSRSEQQTVTSTADGGPSHSRTNSQPAGAKGKGKATRNADSTKASDDAVGSKKAAAPAKKSSGGGNKAKQSRTKG